MPNYVYLLLTLLCFFSNQNVSAQWQTYNIGFNDKLTGIVIQEPKVVVSGYNGIYYSTNGINPGKWMKLTLGTSEYSLSFSRTKFTHCFSDLATGKDQVYACGYDTITREAALYYINMQNWSVKRIYKGKRNSSINKICYSKGLGKYLAVGTGGLILSFDSKGYNIIKCPYTYNLVFISAETDAYGTYLTILSKDYFIRDVIRSVGHEFSSSYSGDGNLKGIAGSYTASYAVGNSYHYVNGPNFYEYHNFEADTLKANCIINFGNYYFVGTEHGVYRTINSTLKNIEYQPGSSNSGVNSFLNYKNGLLATCDNGKLLYTENYGGSTKLYTEIKSNGACLNESAFINANFGSATSCKWYVDGVNVSNSCQSYPQNFKNIKTYEIKLVATNDSGYRDTSVMQYNVVKYPDSKIKFTFSDTVLCKEGQVEVKLDSSEANTYYKLKPGFTATNPVSGYVFGTGSMVKFKTGKLTETGTYLIEAISTKANCSQMLKQKINLRVEKTSAKIYAHSVNIPINDTALFFEHTTDAKNFKWSFNPKPVWYNDSTGRMAAVFNKEGEVKATLICWSDKGCRDTASTTFTNVYDPNYKDSDTCWNLKIHGIDKEYNHHDVNAMFPLRDGGFLIDGSSPTKPIYESRKGKGLEVSLPDLGYVARYDGKGVLNWIIGKDRSPSYGTSTNNTKIMSEDTKGNILVTSPNFLRDAGGKVLNTDQDLVFAKLNRFGELIFMITAKKKKYQSYPLNLFTDNNDNIYSISTNYDNKPTQLFRNGDSLALLKANLVMNSGFNLTKFDTKGNLIWTRPYDCYSLSSEYIQLLNLSIDANSNIYLSGTYRFMLTSCDPVGNHIDTLGPWMNEATENKIGFLQKLDSNGLLKWRCRAYSVNSNKKIPTRTLINESETNANGSTFLLGFNNVISKDYQFIFENADGSKTSTQIGDQYLMKVGADGMAKWIVGTRTNNGYFGNMKDISLRGKELVIMGNSTNDRFTQKPAVFTSTNGDSIVLDFKNYRSDHYLAHYDTNGVLSKILVSGFTENPGYNDNFEAVDFHKNDSEYYILAKHIYYSIKPDLFSFGSAIDLPVDNRPGYLCRFTDNCAITYLPNESCKRKDFVVKQVKSLCDSLISQGGIKYFKSGSYLQRDTFTRNCDTTYRTIHLNLKVDSTIHKFYNINACEQFISPYGSAYDSSGLYSEIFTSISGCDSIVHYDVKISDYKNTYFEDTACRAYQFGNKKSFRQSGYYLDTLVSKSGCDSFVYASIVVYEVESKIEIKDSIMVCLDSTSKYQWLDCSNNKAIAGETNRNFKPLKDGNYACIVNLNNCYDTSVCVPFKIKTISIRNIKNLDIKIYPNPSKKAITIELNEQPENLTFSLFNMSGQLITTKQIRGVKEFNLALPEAEGIYNLHLQYEGGLRVYRIIKN